MAEFTPLPTDYVDDILSSSNTTRKYEQIDNSDGTKSFTDVTEYDQEGSNFGANDINQTNEEINKIYTNRIIDVEDLDLVTEPGFFVDALPVASIYNEVNSNLDNVMTSYGITVLHKKIGNLHTIRIAGNISGQITTHSFTLPEECRPTQAVYDWTRVGTTWCQISIMSSGVVTITPDSPLVGGSYINKWFTYA